MSEHFDPEAGQPLPVTTKQSIDVAVEVAKELKEFGHAEIAKDVEARILLGERKYGKRLQSFNGRDVIKDLYDEVLDALNYAKQAEIEGIDHGGVFFDGLLRVVVAVKSKLG